jgi:hypothetical protein
MRIPVHVRFLPCAILLGLGLEVLAAIGPARAHPHVRARLQHRSRRPPTHRRQPLRRGPRRRLEPAASWKGRSRARRLAARAPPSHGRRRGQIRQSDARDKNGALDVVSRFTERKERRFMVDGAVLDLPNARICSVPGGHHRTLDAVAQLCCGISDPMRCLQCSNAPMLQYSC